jgi:glutamate 5-kinase
MEKVASLLAGARRPVLKVGSSLVAAGEVFRHDGLAADIAGWPASFVVISSGAVALGHRAAPHLSRETLRERQALSAIGQPLLMAQWERALTGADARTAQILLTPDVTDDEERRANARATIETVLAAGIVPIVNENDTVATDELRYGDNDRLAAQTAILVEADLLVLLSDVDGLYETDPRDHPGARHIPVIPRAVLEDPAAHVPAGLSAVGTGGMRSKVEAAALAAAAGIPVIIASGRGERPLRLLERGVTRASRAEP